MTVGDLGPPREIQGQKVKMIFTLESDFPFHSTNSYSAVCSAQDAVDSGDATKQTKLPALRGLTL